MSRSIPGYVVASATVLGVGVSTLACRALYQWIKENRPQLLFMRRLIFSFLFLFVFWW